MEAKVKLTKRKSTLVSDLKDGLIDAVEAIDVERRNLSSLFRLQMISSRIRMVSKFEPPTQTEFKVQTAKRYDFCSEVLTHLMKDRKAGFKVFFNFDDNQIDGDWVTEYSKSTQKKKCPISGAGLGPSDHVKDTVQYWEEKLSPESKFLYLLRLLNDYPERGFNRLMNRPVTFGKLFVEKKTASIFLLKAIKERNNIHGYISRSFLQIGTAIVLTVLKGRAVRAIVLEKKPQETDSESLLIKSVTAAVARLYVLEPELLPKKNDIEKADEADEVIKEAVLAADMVEAFRLLVGTSEDLSYLLRSSLHHCRSISDIERRKETEFSWKVILTTAGVEEEEKI